MTDPTEQDDADDAMVIEALLLGLAILACGGVMIFLILS